MSSFHEKLAGNIRMYPVLYDKSSPSILLINTQKLFFPYRRKPILNRIISTSFLAIGFRCGRIAFEFTLYFSMRYRTCLPLLRLRRRCKPALNLYSNFVELIISDDEFHLCVLIFYVLGMNTKIVFYAS